MKSNKNSKILSPAEFYRQLRPENFSDSTIIDTITLPKEVLALEIEKITTNQKENEFETLARKMSEELITPNLIPQVGPTGGGDGKTDSETYPVSESISIRWFVPENGWKKDEKWAFAFSAKKDWKPKLKKDIENILSTKRDYTRIYFITNQTPSSKKKKDAQDEFIKLFNIDIVILDGKWILEKTYSNDLINLVVESLNLSEVYKKSNKVIGSNDIRREQKLIDIEEQIKNPNRYLEYDFQLVEDALESAILTRKLEKPRDELEAKFDRVERLLKKFSNKGQWVRFLYQKAWTYINYYDDYDNFFTQFENFKKEINDDITVISLEYYTTLFTLYRTLYFYETGNIDIKDYECERQMIYDYLTKIISKKPQSNLSLTAQTHLAHLKLFETLESEEESDKLFLEIKVILLKSEGRLEFPFESFEKMILLMGDVYVASEAYDELFDTLTRISEKRSSHLQAGELYIRRGGQKMSHKRYKDGLIYFGKAVVKLSKEESQYGFYLAQIGLSEAYRKLGLFNASYSSKVSAISSLMKSWIDDGKIDTRMLNLLFTTLSEEILYGRLPHILTWHELYRVIHYQQARVNPENIPNKLIQLDSYLTVRLINGKVPPKVLRVLPSICEREGLELSEDVSLFLLGHIDEIIENYKKIGISTNDGVEEFFHTTSNQPLVGQFVNKMNWFHSENSILTTTILGTEIEVYFKTSNPLIIVAETILAIIEGFLGTSLENIFPNTEKIIFKIEDVKDKFYVRKEKDSNNYTIEWDSSFDPIQDYRKIWDVSMYLLTHLCTYHFLLEDPKKYLEMLFKQEEVNERLSILLNHKIFLKNILGAEPKLTLSDWITSHTTEKKMLRKEIFVPRLTDKTSEFKDSNEKQAHNGLPPLDEIPHNKRKVVSIIDNHLWDNAKWKGVAVLAFQDGVGIVLGFEDISYGNKIFENWISRFGNTDSENQIKISVITEVRKDNPFAYKVMISSNIENRKMDKNSIFVTTMRFHEMDAKNAQTITILKQGFNYFNKFKMCPGRITDDLKVEANTNLFIEKKDITFIKASDVKDTDIESGAFINHR